MIYRCADPGGNKGACPPTILGGGTQYYDVPPPTILCK